MELIEETKTYRIQLEEFVGFDKVHDAVKATMDTMPEWSASKYNFDMDTWCLLLTVRRKL
jgi:hypothetical protein